ncbi:MAG: SAM-dependent methyltransferase [Geodermatophilaceae bacterium]|nr:SAM-dependent methyltransferase [Geodermatophilaceae bacterium]
MDDALYGPDGFYRRPEGPAGHFRTPAQSPPYARAIGTLLRRVDDALDHPPVLDLVDVGAGRGELLRHIASLAVVQPYASRLRLTGVEVAARPRGLPTTIAWTDRIPPVTGVLVATEWLDVIPCDVVELTGAGPRLIEVDDAGREALGRAPEPADAAWLQRWWPLQHVGDRAEIGRPRDEAWAAAVGRVRHGLAVAVDYGHDITDRPPAGTLTGFRAGRERRPVPDTTMDLTAHVALDAAAAVAGVPGLRMAQADALRDLGVCTGSATDTALDRLQTAGESAQLLDPEGFGGFGWLLHGVGVEVPLGSGRQ